MNPRDAVRAHFERRPASADRRRQLADVVQQHVERQLETFFATPDPSPEPPAPQPAPPASRAAVLARFRPAAAPNLSADVRRQVRRILESMREFGFDPGGEWHVPSGLSGLESGWTPRVAGDPINTTIQEVAGCYATRAQVIEAADAILAERPAQLEPRHRPLVGAVVTVATALADGASAVRTDTGTVRIQGPMLPPNWDA